MRFLVDAQLPPALAIWLRGQGHEAQHVMDVGLLAAADNDIIAHAERIGAVMVTKDRDFLSTATTNPPRLQVLWIRTGNLSNISLLERFAAAFPDLAMHLLAGGGLVELR